LDQWIKPRGPRRRYVRPLPPRGVHWDNAHQNNVNDNGTYPKLSAGINHPSGGRAKASGTMIEVVTVSLVFLSAVIFVAHAFAAFRMRRVDESNRQTSTPVWQCELT
jgi:hypothetical protein